MRVGFGTTVLANGLAQGSLDGIGNYTRELMVRLSKHAGTDVLPYAYGDGPIADAMQAMCQAGASPVRGGAFRPQALWSFATGLPFGVLQGALATDVDLVHATDHFIPRLRGVPVVATLMDAIPLAHPEWVTYRFKSLKNRLWRGSAQWAQHVITISDHSRQELVQWFGLPESRVSVTPLGVDTRWFVTPQAVDVQRVRVAYALPERYFLAVGTLQPRKNIGRLIAAHRALPAALRRDVPLVMVGRAGWGCDEEVAQLCAGDGGALRWLQYVPDADLLSLVHQAAALVFPSLHEGFGLPVLEAFAAGVPVVASNTTAVPEVAGDAAMLVGPLDVAGMAEAMAYVVQNESAAQRMRSLGLARAREFTWERTADMTRQVYATVLAGC